MKMNRYRNVYMKVNNYIGSEQLIPSRLCIALILLNFHLKPYGKYLEKYLVKYDEDESLKLFNLETRRQLYYI